jgi:hypothetical protein
MSLPTSAEVSFRTADGRQHHAWVPYLGGAYVDTVNAQLLHQAVEILNGLIASPETKPTDSAKSRQTLLIQQLKDVARGNATAMTSEVGGPAELRSDDTRAGTPMTPEAQEIPDEESEQTPAPVDKGRASEEAPQSRRSVSEEF